MSIFYINSDIEFLTEITKESDGEVFSTNNISNAEYTIKHGRYGDTILTKSLGNGITKLDVNDLKTRIDDTDLTEAGKFWHEMVIYNMAGDKLPPVFSEIIEIK